MLKLASIQRGTHDNNLQIFTLLHNLFKVRVHFLDILAYGTCMRCSPYSIDYLFNEPHEYVGGQRPLVSLVQDDHPIPLQQWVVHGLTKQHTISHVPGRREERSLYSNDEQKAVVVNIGLCRTCKIRVYDDLYQLYLMNL